MKQYRQGDILLVQMDKLPDIAQDQWAKENKLVGPRITLALGEATGHAHVLEAEDAVMYRGEYLEIGVGGGTIVHEEHKAVQLDPGTYRLIHQREYEGPERERQVLD
jgi:hypothetical protein